MAERWLLLASRSPAPHTRTLWRDAEDLAQLGHEVTLVLTDSAVLDAVLEHGPMRQARERNVRVLVDGAAAQRRGLSHRFTAQDVVTTDEVAGMLLDPTLRTVWR